MGSGDIWHAIHYADVFAKYKPVATDDFHVFRIPDHELAAGGVHSVKLVDVAGKARASAGVAECYLAQTPYLPHGVGSVERVHYVDFIDALVGMAQKLVVSQFAHNQVSVNTINYFVHLLIMPLGYGIFAKLVKKSYRAK